MQQQDGRQPSLPARLSSFVGREDALCTVRRLLEEHRLVTLVGAPGVGKTRLAIEALSGQQDAQAHGVVFVSLAGLAEPELVPERIASVLCISTHAGRSTIELLQEYLHTHPLRLILDNSEHLLSACAALAEDLLLSCPELRILATSREALQIDGEMTWRVPSLSTPELDAIGRGDDPLQFEAIRLFVDRARGVSPGFKLTDGNSPFVAQICRRLDGIPLAIELAAARMRLLSVTQIASRLDDRFALLTGGSRTALPRYRTLRGAIDWSYALLDEDERTLLRRLAVFAGGWTLDAVEAICDGGMRDAESVGASLAASDPSRNAAPDPSRIAAPDPSRIAAPDHSLVPRPSMLDLLGSLVDKSLVQVEAAEGQEPRYRFLEMIQQYALERLREAGEEMELRRRHLAWAVDLPNPDLTMVHAPSGPAWMDRLGAEIDNLRAALAWSVSDPDATSARTGLRLASALYGFWYTRFQLTEGYHWLKRTLAADAEYARGGDWTPEGVGVWPGGVGAWGAHPRIAALNLLANLAEDIWDQEEAFRRSEETLALARAAGDRQGEGHAIVIVANYARRYGQYERSASLFEEALVIFRETDDPHSLCAVLGNFGKTCVQMGNNAQAEPMIRESLAIARSSGFTSGEAELVCRLGELTFRQGDLTRAMAYLEQSLSLCEQIGAERGRIWSLLTLGQIHLVQEDARLAAGCFVECLVACHEAGNWLHFVRSLEGLAAAATLSPANLTAARARHAVQLLAAAATQREQSAGPIVPVERPTHDRTLDVLRTYLDQDAFSTVWDDGLATPPRLAVEIGVALARQIEEEPLERDRAAARPTPSASEQQALLTPREREIVALIGQAFSNRQIAERLVVTERTVEVHARNIRERLGLETRAQMVAWAIQHGLAEQGE